MPQPFDPAKNERAILDELSRASERALRQGTESGIRAYAAELDRLGNRLEGLSRRYGQRLEGVDSSLIRVLKILEREPSLLIDLIDFMSGLSELGDEARHAAQSAEVAVQELQALAREVPELRSSAGRLERAVLRQIAHMRRLVSWGTKAAELSKTAGINPSTKS